VVFEALPVAVTEMRAVELGCFVGKIGSDSGSFVVGFVDDFVEVADFVVVAATKFDAAGNFA